MKKQHREERIHDGFRCYGLDTGRIFYTKHPDGIGEPLEEFKNYGK